MTYIERQLTSRILDSLQRNPVTAIIGARQVGKSTLAKKLIAQHRQAELLTSNSLHCGGLKLKKTTNYKLTF